MTETLSNLAQVTPSATTLTTLYTVPSSTSTVVSSIYICNTNSSNITFRISYAIAAAADATKQYLYYDLPLLANDTFVATVGLSMATTDLLRCYASSTGVSFQVFGAQIT